MTELEEGSSLIKVDKHALLAGVGPDDSDIWVCIQQKDDWRTCKYENFKTCPICGGKVK